MKKSEVIKLLEDNRVYPSNLLTFINKNKKLKLDYTKCKKWLLEIERKESLSAEKLLYKNLAKKIGVSVKELHRLQDKGRLILSDFDTGHTMGCNKELYIVFKCEKKPITLLETSNTKEYSKGCKYNANHGSISIGLTLNELKSIERVNSVWTISGKDNKATWLEGSGRKGNYQVKKVKGYLIGSSHALTIEEGERLEMLKSLDINKNEMGYVGVVHLKKMGACSVGINQFISKYGLNPSFGYQIAYLKSLEPSNGFLKRF